MPVPLRGWQGRVWLSFLPSLKVIPMNIQCPQCDSSRITTRNIGKRTGGTIGVVGGGLQGAAGALSGARFGGLVGAIGGAPGMAIGTLAGAILGGLIGGAAGGITGAKIGEVVDERILDNYQCLDCDHRFSLPRD